MKNLSAFDESPILNRLIVRPATSSLSSLNTSALPECLGEHKVDKNVSPSFELNSLGYRIHLFGVPDLSTHYNLPVILFKA